MPADEKRADIATAAARIYIHETIEITVRHRSEYLAHFVNWGPISRRLYNMRQVGVWAVNGSTHRWPEAIVLWELDGAAAFAKMLKGEYAHLDDASAPVGDHYTLYWRNGVEGVTDKRGTDRMLAPAAYSPSLADLLAKPTKHAGYLHQTVKGPPGSINDFLFLVQSTWQPVALRFGLKLVGAYRSMMVSDDEAILIWAIPTWDQWAAYELGLYADKDAVAWRDKMACMGISWEGKLLKAAPGCPIEVGLVTEKK